MAKANVTDRPEVALQWLKNGQIIAYPTESVWGLGCNPFDEQAVKKLLHLKNRPIEKGVIVLTADEFFIQDFLTPLPIDRHNAISQSWQYASDSRQATSWLLPIPSSVTIPNSVRGEHTSLAVRVINHAKISQLCELIAMSGLNPFGFLVSTSCNVGGELPASDFATAYRYFGDEIGYLTGETLGYDKPSQILDGLTGGAVRS